jgi:hypothetical protein
MGNWADLQRQQNKQQVQNAKQIQEMNQNYNDRENKVNGFAGSASQMLDVGAYQSKELFRNNGRRR